MDLPLMNSTPVHIEICQTSIKVLKEDAGLVSHNGVKALVLDRLLVPVVLLVKLILHDGDDVSDGLLGLFGGERHKKSLSRNCCATGGR